MAADVTAKVVIYEAFVEGMLEAPKHRARSVHDLCTWPKYGGIPAANDLESLEFVLPRHLITVLRSQIEQ